MRGPRRPPALALAFPLLPLLALLLPMAGGAQEVEHAGRDPWLRAGASAVAGGTRLDPAPGGGGAVAEVRVEQPILFAHAGGTAGPFRLRAHGMLNFEGVTLSGGVLTMGAFGEGFVDRRHPHAYLHELVVTAEAGSPMSGAVSLAAGRGFAAFGTDDPMNRPPLRYPVNHHWAQILERAVVTAGVRRGGVMLEASLFNGDEPESPGRGPNLGRFGDSWSARLLVQPVPGLELQGSRASVASPEHRAGAGPDAIRWSASARLERRSAYVLLEWARTTEAEGAFAFESLLAEGAWRLGRHRPYVRAERTERPEEERALDPFRSLRPHLDDSILGTTRWTILTAGWSGAWTGPGGVRLEPLGELSAGRVVAVEGGLFDPTAFYGSRTAWSATVAVRIGLGRPHRMGRYGVVAPGAGAHDGGMPH